MIGVLCFVGPAAQAATVALDLRDYGDGTYDLFASVSIGDNFGIAYYNIDLVNILTAVHQSPLAQNTSWIPTGFTGAGVNLSGDGALFSYQNTGAATAPGTLLYGIGQTAGTFAVPVGPPSRGVPWTAPVLLASGTYDIGGPAPWFGPEAVVNVFAIEWTEGPIPPGLLEAAESLGAITLIPHADADGPYVIDAGETLNLDGTGSSSGGWAGGAITSYSWDLDNDGSFETGGESPNLSYSYLESLGLGVGGPYDIGLEVWNNYGYSDTDSSQLTITPEPATLGLLLMGGLALLRKRK